MKIFLTLLFNLLFLAFSLAQIEMAAAISEPEQLDLPEFKLDKDEFEKHLRYLASDELQGRRTASPGGEKAAQYIAEQFKSYGLTPASEAGDFFQNVPFENLTPPTSGSLKLDKSEFKVGEDFLIFKGGKTDLKAEAIFAKNGWVDEATGVDDYKGLDVKGKIVFVLPGEPGSQNPFDVFKAMSKKRQLASERGAVALIELFRLNFPWQFFKGYFGKERMELADETAEKQSSLLYGWLKEGTPNPVADLEKGKKLPVQLTTSGVETQRLQALNVIGMVKGTELPEEFVVVSAHYDHVGVGKEGGAPFTPEDSIFNGARDNAMGVAALLAAAKSLSQSPPRRSVLFLACTGEEMGMLGSAYFADHPPVPLEKMVFNLNNDGAGYNSKDHVTVIGWDITNINPEVEKAAAAFSLKVFPDPAPEQNLYERSDNISFAKKGIPAIDYAPGTVEMNEEIFHYYHTPADNPDTIDYDYLLKFCQAFAHTARLIADKKELPGWTPGSKFEQK